MTAVGVAVAGVVWLVVLALGVGTTRGRAALREFYAALCGMLTPSPRPAHRATRKERTL